MQRQSWKNSDNRKVEEQKKKDKQKIGNNGYHRSTNDEHEV